MYKFVLCCYSVNGRLGVGVPTKCTDQGTTFVNPALTDCAMVRNDTKCAILPPSSAAFHFVSLPLSQAGVIYAYPMT